MHLDTNGIEIKVGDYLVFSVVHNLTARLRYGKVLKLNEKTITTKAYSINMHYDWTGNGAKVNYNDPHKDYVITHVVEEFKPAAFNYPELKSLVVPYEIIPEKIRQYIESK